MWVRFLCTQSLRKKTYFTYRGTICVVLLTVVHFAIICTLVCSITRLGIDAGRDGWTRLARPNSQARTGTGEYSFSLFSWPRAGLATLPGWSIPCYTWWPYIHTYIHTRYCSLYIILCILYYSTPSRQDLNYLYNISINRAAGPAKELLVF